MKNMFKDTLILAIITLVAGCVLGLVYENTKDIIAAREEATKQEAYAKVFSDASSFNNVGIEVTEAEYAMMSEQGIDGVVINEVIDALDSEGNVVGTVFTVTSTKGYGGDIQFTCGIRKDGTVNGISLLTINETAGLGMNAEKVLVPQFSGKMANMFQVTKTGATDDSQIDAISGATITSNAITGGVNGCLYYYNNMYNGGENNE